MNAHQAAVVALAVLFVVMVFAAAGVQAAITYAAGLVTGALLWVLATLPRRTG